MPNRISFTVLLFTFSFRLFSQNDFKPGYIITNNLDTIQGLISMKSGYKNSQRCTFKKDKKSKKTEYSPEQIQAYRFTNDKYYVSKTITLDNETRKVFLEYLVNGVTKLYFLNAKNNSIYYVETDSGKTVILENNEVRLQTENGEKVYKSQTYKGVLRYLYNNDTSIYKEINNTKFNSESLIKLSKQYHYDMCPDRECKVYVQENMGQKWISVHAGIRREILRMQYSSDKAITDQPFFGIQMRFVPKFWYSRLNFLTGIDFSNVDTEGDFENDIYYDKRAFNIHIKSNIIDVPFKFEYTILTKRLSGGIYGGIRVLYFLNPKTSVYQINFGPWKDTAFYRWKIGLNAGIELRYALNQKINLTLQSGFDYHTSLFKNHHVLHYTYFENIPILLGLEFKI